MGPGLLLQLGTSLAAIFGITWLARKLRLGGGDVRIRDEDHVRELADQAVDGFDPVAIGLDRARVGAIARDAGGRVLLLRRHGSHFVGRLLTDHAGARLDRNFLTISTGDRRFGTCALDLGPEAQVWASSLRHLPGGAAGRAIGPGGGA
ncbi:hypothetical protein [Novosphingobium lentum]|uniref:hypothetical protein n=1 Tax=Novosphingobium lentum TaxID=145287 RepID=UPI00082B46E1|nr:hypothetical protein [Novosphingobium lentum]